MININIQFNNNIKEGINKYRFILFLKNFIIVINQKIKYRSKKIEAIISLRMLNGKTNAQNIYIY